MKRLASEVLRDLEIRIARLERQATRPLNEVALELIQKRHKGLNRILSRQGIEMKKPIGSGSIYFYVEGVDGVLEVMESRQKENELTVDHKVVGAGVVSSWTMDVNEFISSNTDNPNTYEIKEWDLTNTQSLGRLLKSGLKSRVARLERQAKTPIIFEKLYISKNGRVFFYTIEEKRGKIVGIEIDARGMPVLESYSERDFWKTFQVLDNAGAYSTGANEVIRDILKFKYENGLGSRSFPKLS